MSLRRVLVATALVAVLASSLFSGWLSGTGLPFKPEKAYAVGSPIFTYQTRSYSGKRTDENTILLQGRFEIAEDGIRDDSLGFVTTNLTLGLTSSDGSKDTWKINSIVFSNASFGSNNASASGSTIVIKGQSFGFNSSNYSFQYQKNADPDKVGLIILRGSDPVSPSGGINNEHPVSAFQVAANERFRGGGSLRSLPVDNYGNPGTQNSSSDYSKWLANISSIHITVDESSADVPPPYINISKDDTVGRPALKFVLSLGEVEGSFIVNSRKWLLFLANELTDSGGLTPINGLYFVANDTNNNTDSYFLFAPGVPVSVLIASGMNNEGTYVLRPPGGLTVPDSEVNKVFGYILDVPKNKSNDCGGSVETYKTGPESPDGKTVPDIQRKYAGSVTESDARFLNINCLNKTSTGWPAKWGVKFTDVSGGGGCTIRVITAGLTDGIGTVMVKIFACVIQTIINGVFTPLTELTQGAGEQTGVLEANLAGTGSNKGFHDAWKFSLGLINIFVILALLAIAFANILHLNINTYAAKKALPGLVIGVIGANASLLLIRFILDVAKSLQIFAFEIANNPPLYPVADTGQFVSAFMTKIGMAAFENDIINGAFVLLGPITLIVILIFAIFMFYLVFVFAWGMVKRLVYIYGLTVLAPLAFVAYGVPGQQQWFTKWWDMMLRQIFMLPIVFLGAAMLIKYVDITVVPPNRTGALDVSNLINMLIVFLMAAAILKLPGLITKGAIDISGAAKKAFGMAKTTPQNVLGFTAGQMKSRAGKYWTGKETASRAKIDAMKRSGNRAGALEEARRLKANRKNWRKRAESGGKSLDPWRAYSTIAGNPEIFYAAYQDRMKQAATDRKVEFNSTKAGDVPLVPVNWAAQKLGLYAAGTGIRGIASGRKSEVNAGIDDVNDYIARGGDIQKLIQDVMLKDGKDRDVWSAIKSGVDTGRIKDEDILSFAGRTNKSSLQKAVLGLVNENGLAGHDSGWRSHGVIREIYEAVNKEVLSRTRNTDLSLSEKNEMTLRYVKDAVRNNGDFKVTVDPSTVIPVGGGNSPRAAAAAAGGGGAVPSGSSGGGDGANVPGGKITNVRVVGQTVPLKIDQAGFDNHFSQIMENSKSLKDTVSSEELKALADHVLSGNTPDGIDIKGLQDAMKGVSKPGLHPKIEATIDPDDLKRMADDLSIAIGDGIERSPDAIQQRLAGSYAAGDLIDRENQDIASKLDEEKLAKIMSDSLETAVGGLNEVLGGSFDRLNETLKQSGQTGKDKLAVLQKMVTELQQLKQSISGKGQYSLRSVINNMGSRMAKTMEIGHMSIGSQIKEAAANKSDVNVVIKGGGEQSSSETPPAVQSSLEQKQPPQNESEEPPNDGVPR
ncbi:MAG: hypothetical protein Q8Q05_03550 [bacterium]|nr:hypothetical protein [bacterium]